MCFIKDISSKWSLSLQTTDSTYGDSQVLRSDYLLPDAPYGLDFRNMSPAEARVHYKSYIADIPELVAKQRAAPSSAARRFSNIVTVGL